MGNQTSRNEKSTRATFDDDPYLDTMRQWHASKKDEPYKRQYPLPTIANDHNRVKPRKQSSPAAVTSINNKKTLAKLFHRNSSSSNSSSSSKRINLPRTGSYTDTITHTQDSSLTTLASATQKINLNNDTPFNTTNNNSRTCSPVTSSNTTPQRSPFIHPLAQPAIPDHHVFPYETEPFSIPALELRRLTNRVSLNSSELRRLLYQQQLFDQQPQEFKINCNRKYHKADPSNYLLPCDDEEIDRLHLQHFMIRFAIQGNYLAPVSDVLRKGGRVLDIGCGPGSWSMEIAGEYPKSSVIGIDMAPIYPRDIKPTNCDFYQCNILSPPLPFEDNTFDYIFMRFMSLGVETDAWTSVLSELVRVLKPNGWIEWIEADVEIHRPGPNTFEFNRKLINLMLENKQDPSIGKKLKEKLEEIDELTHTTSTFVSCPGGQWAGKLGQLTIQSWKAYYNAFSPLLRQGWEITEVEYNEKLKACWREADEYKSFENVHFSYAQKKPSTSATVK